MLALDRRIVQGTTDKESPLVSVIMATYNEKPDVVCAAIESILNQTYAHLELIIFDDSTDEGTICALDAFMADERLQIHHSARRIGFVASLNCGLEAARGKYIARMDGDDVSYPDRLEKEVAYLEVHDKVGVVGGSVDIINENGEAISKRTFPDGGVKLSLYAGVRSPLAHPTVMMRREVVEAGFRYDGALEMSEDLDLWLRLLNNGYSLANIDDTLLRYRVNGNFAERRTKREQIECMASVRKKNMSARYPVRSFISWCTAEAYLHMPSGLFRRLYGAVYKYRRQ